MAATGFIAAATTLAAAFDAELALVVSLTQVIIFAFTLGIWGLVYYLAYLLTGRAGLFWPLAVLYGLYFLLQVYLLHAQVPIGYDASGWRPILESARPLEGPMVDWLLTLPLIPLAIGLVGLLFLLPRAPDPTQRYRIVLIEASLLLWIVAVILVSRPDVAESVAWQVLARTTILASGLTILLAYRPPHWVQVRWNVQASA